MKLKKVMALTMAGAMAATTLTACGSSSSTTETTKAAETTAAAAADTTAAAAADNGSSDAETVLQVAFENSISEPVGQGWEKAQEIIKEKSGGKMAIEIYPDSQLGDKSSLIDSMLLGENVAHLQTVLSTLTTVYRISVSYSDRSCSIPGIRFGNWLIPTGTKSSVASLKKKA